jgi:hypothetical protein
MAGNISHVLQHCPMEQQLAHLNTASVQHLLVFPRGIVQCGTPLINRSRGTKNHSTCSNQMKYPPLTPLLNVPPHWRTYFTTTTTLAFRVISATTTTSYAPTRTHVRARVEGPCVVYRIQPLKTTNQTKLTHGGITCSNLNVSLLQWAGNSPPVARRPGVILSPCARPSRHTH